MVHTPCVFFFPSILRRTLPVSSLIVAVAAVVLVLADLCAASAFHPDPMSILPRLFLHVVFFFFHRKNKGSESEPEPGGLENHPVAQGAPVRSKLGGPHLLQVRRLHHRSFGTRVCRAESPASVVLGVMIDSRTRVVQIFGEVGREAFFIHIYHDELTH